MNQYIAKSENQAGNGYIGSFIKAVYNHKQIEVFNTITGKSYILFYDNDFYKSRDINNNIEVLTEEEIFNMCMKIVDFHISYKILN
jgi:hypothetical protein